MQRNLKIGLIGMDTSHSISFTQLLNDSRHPYHVAGGTVVVGFPGGSPDFELSISRVEGFTKQLKDQFGIKIVESPEIVAEESDAILILSGDGRVHLDQFRRIVSYGKPVFIDKPLAVQSKEAEQIMKLASTYNVSLISSSASRFSDVLRQALKDDSKGCIVGADVYGPTDIVPTQPGFFWYGIHSIEMLYTIMGPGCKQVMTTSSAKHDLIVGIWEGGSLGTMRGNRVGNRSFGVTIHREKGSEYVDITAHPKPRQASLLVNLLNMFRTGEVTIKPEETLEMIRFIEAANESRDICSVVDI